MMFHLAPPEVKGLGSITSRSSLIRSSQVRMFFGLPLRTMNTTIESVTNPSYSFLFQFLSTSPASTSLVMSGSRENSTTSAGRPPSTARDCSPDDAYDWSKLTPSPWGLLLQAGSRAIASSAAPEAAAGRIAASALGGRVEFQIILHLVNRFRFWPDASTK